MRGAIFMLAIAGGLAGGTAAAGAEPARLPLYRQLMHARGGDAAALAQLVQISRELPPTDAAELYDVLADAHLTAGAIDLAADVRRTLAAEYPGEPAAHAAMLWLVRTYASSEVALARRVATGTPPAKGNPDEGMLAYALTLGGGTAEREAPWRDDAAIAFQRAVATRRLGQSESAKALYGATKRTKAPGVWRECVLCEEWLANRGDEPAPKPTTIVRRAAAPPKLDGQLDEDCWRLEGSALATLPANAAPGTAACELRFAYDAKYLYAAILCPQASGVDYPPPGGARTRDTNLAESDRVALLLDVDRDYATWFDLTVDSRGWPAEGCMGDGSWNPRWFIAASESADPANPRWVVELAIPFSELTVTAPQSGDAWAAALVRRTPGRAALSWVGFARETPEPAGFGLLLFE